MTTKDAPAGSTNRRAVTIGAGVGLVLVLIAGAIAGYLRLTAPDRPNLRSASLEDVLAYVAHPRGLGQLADIEQEQFVAALKERFQEDAAHRELKSALDELTKDQLDAIRHALEPLLFEKIIAKAREYRRVAVEARYAFLQSFDREMAEDAAWLSGYGDPEKNLTGKLGQGMPSNPEQWIQYLHQHTTPAERQLLETLVTDLKSYHGQQRA
ncbi:MAG: hypothetical protein V3T70_07640 [Phycisphaerae bacterium]